MSTLVSVTIGKSRGGQSGCRRAQPCRCQYRGSSGCTATATSPSIVSIRVVATVMSSSNTHASLLLRHTVPVKLHLSHSLYSIFDNRESNFTVLDVCRPYGLSNNHAAYQLISKQVSKGYCPLKTLRIILEACQCNRSDNKMQATKRN